MGVADRVDDHGGEIDAAHGEVAAGVQPREQQQVVDQPLMRSASDSTRRMAWPTSSGTPSSRRRMSSA